MRTQMEKGTQQMVTSWRHVGMFADNVPGQCPLAGLSPQSGVGSVKILFIWLCWVFTAARGLSLSCGEQGPL